MAIDDSLADVVRTGIDAALLDLHTCMPGTENTCDVQPAVRRKLDGELETLPVIKSVPVAWVSGAGGILKLGLEAGDTVWLMFSEAAWAKFQASGQVSEASDETRHSLSYPIAYPIARKPVAGALGPGWYTPVPVYVGDPSATPVALFAALDALRTALLADLAAFPIPTPTTTALDSPAGAFALLGASTKLKAK
jgi:hypothetical protein